MAAPTVPPNAQRVNQLLDSPEIGALVADLQETRWTGRPGYPIRAMVGMCLVKSLYGLPTWTRTVRLVAEHAALQEALGAVPGVDACYRFTAKLRRFTGLLEACTTAVLARLREELPGMGSTVAIDGSDLPAHANGQRRRFDGSERTAFGDPDASWGHRSSISTRKGGGYYGYKVHAAVCTETGLPLAWRVATARDHDALHATDLLDRVLARGFRPTFAVMDKGYDVPRIYEACGARGIRPVIALKRSPRVKAGLHRPPTCGHGERTFAGSDAGRGASKWRCPTGACSPASTWLKADRLHTLVPRSTTRWGDIYRRRGAVEREFGRLKHEWAMLPLRVRRIERVRLHVDLTVLTRLAVALDRLRASESAAAA